MTSKFNIKSQSTVTEFKPWLVDGDSLKKFFKETRKSMYEFVIFSIGLKKWSEVAQSCSTLCDPMDCSLPGYPVHGIFQAIVLEWIAISFSRGSSQPRDPTQVSCIAGGFLTSWTMREATLVYPSYSATMGNSQSQPSKSTPLGCLLRNLKALGFQEAIRPKRLIYYSNTLATIQTW